MMMMIEGDRNEKDKHPVCKDSQEANGITHCLLYNVCIIMQMMIIFTSFLCSLHQLYQREQNVGMIIQSMECN